MNIATNDLHWPNASERDLRIHTERLELFACPARAARAVSSGRAQVQTLLGAQIAADWFNGEARSLLSYYAHWIAQDASLLGWGLWLIELREANLVIGSVGFKGRPDAAGVIEIGYGISASYRRRGYTFEAAQALVAWGFAQPGVRSITAECLPDNIGSIRILEKLGMRQVGFVHSYLRWRLDKTE